MTSLSRARARILSSYVLPWKPAEQGQTRVCVIRTRRYVSMANVTHGGRRARAWVRAWYVYMYVLRDEGGIGNDTTYDTSIHHERGRERSTLDGVADRQVVNYDTALDDATSASFSLLLRSGSLVVGVVHCGRSRHVCTTRRYSFFLAV